MKLSQMTDAQLEAKRAKIDRILAERRSKLVDLFRTSHDRLLKQHKAAGGKTFKGTFAEFINELFRRCMKGNDIFENNAYVIRDDTDEHGCSSVFGDDAYLDDSGEQWIDIAPRSGVPTNSIRREWMLSSAPLTWTEVRVLLRDVFAQVILASEPKGG